MKYYKGHYMDGSTAITCETDEGEPYATVTVCLVEYGMKPPTENHVFVPTYKFSDQFYQQLKKDLIKKEVSQIPIGYGKGLLVELRDDWKEICN